MTHDGYIICTAPRSGSTLLCRLMTAAGAGAPHSYFRSEDVLEWAEDWNVSSHQLPASDAQSSEYLDAAIKAGRGGTQVFGLRLMHESLDGLLSYLTALYPNAASDLDRLEAAFGSLLFVHLVRDDSVAQAVSLLRAEQSGLWHRGSDGSDIERLPPKHHTGYDFDRLHAHVTELNQQKTGWQTWFEERGVRPLLVTYDDLADRPAEVVKGICSACGVDVSPDHMPRPDTAILRDDVSVQWARQYAADLGTKGSRLLT